MCNTFTIPDYTSLAARPVTIQFILLLKPNLTSNLTSNNTLCSPQGSKYH